MDNKPETGVNKQYAQGEATKDSDKVSKFKGLKDLKDLKLSGWQMADLSVKLMEVPATGKEAQIFYEGKHVGTLSLKDGKTFHFEGNMDDSAATLLVLLKRFIDNWLQLKDK